MKLKLRAIWKKYWKNQKNEKNPKKREKQQRGRKQKRNSSINSTHLSRCLLPTGRGIAKNKFNLTRISNNSQRRFERQQSNENEKNRETQRRAFSWSPKNNRISKRGAKKLSFQLTALGSKKSNNVSKSSGSRANEAAREHRKRKLDIWGQARRLNPAPSVWGSQLAGWWQPCRMVLATLARVKEGRRGALSLCWGGERVESVSFGFWLILLIWADGGFYEGGLTL